MAAKSKPQKQSTTASIVDRVLGALNPAVHGMIWHMLPVEWRHAPTPPKDPVRAKTAKAWKVYDPQKPVALRKREKNWFYADLVFPAAFQGVAIGGTDAMIDING